MRQIGTLDNETHARRFSAHLTLLDIGHEVEGDGKGGWLIWVESDDDLERAGAELTTFRATPDDPRYAKAPAKIAKVVAEAPAKKDRHRAVDVRTTWGRGGEDGLPGPVCGGLMVFAIGVFALGISPETAELKNLLYISEFVTPFPGLTEVFSGQVWRLVTPIFLHFGLMHIFFNLYAIAMVGTMIERLEGVAFTAVFTLAVAITSNLTQLFMVGPNFGGLSGVAYAFLTYALLHGKFVRGSSYNLDPITAGILVIWLLLGFVGVIPHMANWAHLGGLLGGAAAFGYAVAARR